MVISESQIKAALKRIAAKETKRIDLHDDGGRGAGRLFLRLTGNGGTFYAVYWRGGQRIMARIGAYDPEGRQGGLTLAAARKKFQAEFAPAIVSGSDPESVVVRRARQQTSGTVKQLFEAYIASLRAAGKRSADNVEWILLTGGDNAADAIGADRTAADIEPGDLVPHLADIHKRGAAVLASQVRAYVGAAFAFGMKAEHDYTQASAGASWGIKANPVLAIPIPEGVSTPGQRFLSPSEFRQLWLWLERHDEHSRFSPAVRLMLATGQRVEEILRITTTVYDKANRMCEWPRTKNGMPHAIPLPHQAVAILDGLMPNKHGLFFHYTVDPTRPAHYASAGDVVRTFLEQHPDFPWFVQKDIRRTWKSLAGFAGVSKEGRDRLQNHAKSDISATHYDRYDYLAEKRADIARWEKYLDLVLSGTITELGQRSDNIVPIGAAAAG
jgi:integrase